MLKNTHTVIPKYLNLQCKLDNAKGSTAVSGVVEKCKNYFAVLVDFDERKALLGKMCLFTDFRIFFLSPLRLKDRIKMHLLPVPKFLAIRELSFLQAKNDKTLQPEDVYILES